MYCLSTYTRLVNTTFVTNTRKPSNGTIFFFTFIEFTCNMVKSGLHSLLCETGAPSSGKATYMYGIYWEKGIKQFPKYDEKWLDKHWSVSTERQWGTKQSRPGLAPPQDWCYAPRHAFVHCYMVKEGERRADMAALEKDYEGGCRLRWVGGRGWLKAFKNRPCFIDVRGTQTCLIRRLLLLIAVNYCSFSLFHNHVSKQLMVPRGPKWPQSRNEELMLLYSL